MCNAAAARPPEGGRALPSEGQQRLKGQINLVNDDGVTGAVPGAYETELQDGVWMRKDSQEAKNWRTMRDAPKPGGPPPPDMVNNQRIQADKNKTKKSGLKARKKTQKTGIDSEQTASGLSGGGINI